MLGYGPVKRKERPGVPQDHFVKVPWNSRFAAVDHRGRITALIAEGEPPESGDTDTLTLPFVTTRLGGSEPITVEEVWTDVNRINDEHAALEPWCDQRKTIFASLLQLLRSFGIADADLPVYREMHAKTSVTHSHSHAAMGSQGSDSTHSHQHTHNGDASHSHHSSSASNTDPVVHRHTGTPEELSAKINELRLREMTQDDGIERMTITAVVASGEIELEMAVRWDDAVFDPYWQNKDGTLGKMGSFVSTLPDTDFAMVAAGADIPQIVDDPGAAWHAVLCVEGLRTDEDPGREIMAGACAFPDLPVSLRLQIHDEGGHWGAVTCGRIDEMDRTDMQGYNAITGNGVFGTDEHGQKAQLLVTEQTQRFISIDPRAVDMQIIEIEVNASDGYYDCDDEPILVDWWIRYTSLTIGAATIVATPALQQAVITLASVDLPETPIAVANAATSTITADGSPSTVDLAAPPTTWFDDPGFTAGDRRLVRQADGFYACPVTVTPEGEVFGHVAYWGANHTGFPGQSRKPPHSSTYSHFMTGSTPTSSGTAVAIGNLTMNCGHADVNMGFEAARMHYRAALGNYDGGYGAIQVANVRAGEDEFGIWVHGSICEGVSDKDIRKFMSLGLSGDWRTIAGELTFLACLAVPVPGFPISREDVLMAAANIIDAEAVRAGMDSTTGQLTSLVAAGRVRRIAPEDQIALLQGQVDILMRAHLRAQEAQELLDLAG
jgi:hypothetical protein